MIMTTILRKKKNKLIKSLIKKNHLKKPTGIDAKEFNELIAREKLTDNYFKSFSTFKCELQC